MSEIKKTPVVWQVERLMCDCGGEFISTDEVLTSYPPLYPMRCNKCEGKITQTERYPRVTWEQIPEHKHSFLPYEDRKPFEVCECGAVQISKELHVQGKMR